MTIVDSHCHLDDFEDVSAVIAQARAAGVTKLLAIGAGYGTDRMQRALELAQAHPEVYATAGIHPQQAHEATAENLARLAALADDARCLAVGEIGLDYYHLSNPDVATQQAAFVAQMEIAAAVRKPIAIHCRTSELAVAAAKEKYGAADAWEDLLGLIAEHWTPTGLAGIMHCFSGNQEQAERSLAAGFYVSFAGNLTYPKSAGIQAVARVVPADRMLVETDAPFLAPVPHRGERNEPARTAVTARFLAELRGVSVEEVAAQTTANFEALFPAAR